MRDKLNDRFLANRNIDLEQKMEAVVNELSGQLKTVIEQLHLMTAKSQEHEKTLSFLQQKAVENAEVKKPIDNNQLTMDLFRIPDPIKSIPEFDGNRKQLTAWLQTAEDTLNVFAPLVPEPQYRLYLQAVSNKIKGKAKDQLCLAGNPQSFQEIKAILQETLGDKQELPFYKSQLWATKQTESMSVHTYFNKVKEIVQNIKTLARQNVIYSHAWLAINTFIEEDALAAFISGLRRPYFGYAQAAKPNNIEEAYAFLCKFNSNEIISENSRKSNQITSKITQPFQKHRELPQNKPNLIKSSNVSTGSRSVGGRKHIPMDIELSARSRNTFKRNIINTHELCEEDGGHEVDNEDTEVPENSVPEFEVNLTNFQETQQDDTED